MSNVTVSTVRFPSNYTDFLVVKDGVATGYFTLQLGGGNPETFPAFIVGQRILPGTEENYQELTTQIIDGHTVTINSVYQFNPTEETVAAGGIDLKEYGQILLDVFLKKSGYQGPAEFITLMAAGKMSGKVVETERNGSTVKENHYMVDGLVFAKAPYTGQ